MARHALRFPCLKKENSLIILPKPSDTEFRISEEEQIKSI